jgi:hypothetical protein
MSPLANLPVGIQLTLPHFLLSYYFWNRGGVTVSALLNWSFRTERLRQAYRDNKHPVACTTK